MRVRDIMTNSVHTVREDDILEDAIALLIDKHVTTIPVLDADDTVVGMISEGDLLRWRIDQRRHASDATAKDLMNPDVISMPPDTDTSEAAAAMLHCAIHSLPVLDDGKLVGIISRGDLLRTLVTTDDLIHREIQHRLDEYARGEHRWTVRVRDRVARIDGGFADDSERDIVTILARTVSGVTDVTVDGQTGLQPANG